MDISAAVDGIAERINHAADQLFTDRNFDDSAAATDLIALLQAGVVPEQHDTTVVLFPVHDHAAEVSVELNQLTGHGVRHAGNPADAVRYADDRALLIDCRAAIHGGQLLLQGIDEFLIIMLQNRNRFLCAVQHSLQGRVVNRIADAQVNAADQAFVRIGVQLQLLIRCFDSRSTQGLQNCFAHPLQLRF